MGETKENMLRTALRLFARQGYEATSISDIAAELGMTKSALYKHYAGKQAIFDAIVARMAGQDAERAQENGVPAEATKATGARRRATRRAMPGRSSSTGRRMRLRPTSGVC